MPSDSKIQTELEKILTRCVIGKFEIRFRCLGGMFQDGSYPVFFMHKISVERGLQACHIF